MSRPIGIRIFGKPVVAASALVLGILSGCGDSDEDNGATSGTGGAFSSGGFVSTAGGAFGSGGSSSTGGRFGRPGGGGFGNEGGNYAEGSEDFSQCLAEFCPVPNQGEACCVRRNGPCGVDRGNGCVEGRPSDYEGSGGRDGSGGRGGGGRDGSGGTPEMDGGRDAASDSAAPPDDAGVEASAPLDATTSDVASD